METIELKSIKNHNCRLVAVPDELLPSGKYPRDIKKIKDKSNGKVYEVLENYYHKKGEGIFPTALFLIATGAIVKPENIWSKYPKSDIIYLFVCKDEEVTP